MQKLPHGDLGFIKFHGSGLYGFLGCRELYVASIEILSSANALELKWIWVFKFRNAEWYAIRESKDLYKIGGIIEIKVHIYHILLVLEITLSVNNTMSFHS